MASPLKSNTFERRPLKLRASSPTTPTDYSTKATKSNQRPGSKLIGAPLDMEKHQNTKGSGTNFTDLDDSSTDEEFMINQSMVSQGDIEQSFRRPEVSRLFKTVRRTTETDIKASKYKDVDKNPAGGPPKTEVKLGEEKPKVGATSTNT